MTLLEVRAMLARVDARQLREDAGISQAAVSKAFGIPARHLNRWERGLFLPSTQAGFRWARVIAALERRAEFTSEVEQELAALDGQVTAGVPARRPPAALPFRHISVAAGSAHTTLWVILGFPDYGKRGTPGRVCPGEGIMSGAGELRGGLERRRGENGQGGSSAAIWAPLDEERALDALRFGVAKVYECGIDRAGVWWACRLDGGTAVCGKGPDDLIRKILIDMGVAPAEPW